MGTVDFNKWLKDMGLDGDSVKDSLTINPADFMRMEFSLPVASAILEKGYKVSSYKTYHLRDKSKGLFKVFTTYSDCLKSWHFNNEEEWGVWWSNHDYDLVVRKVDNKIRTICLSNDLNTIEMLFSMIDKLVSPFKGSSDEAKINYVIHDGYEIRTVSRKFESQTYYELPFLPDIEDYVDKFFESKSPCLFLYGPPGTGKTFFAWKLADYYRQKVKGNMFFVRDIEVVGDSGFWFDELLHSLPVFVIFDDLDVSISKEVDCKLSRAFTKYLKYFVDSFVPDNNTKLIFTFNSPTIGIDDDILRPGRTFDLLEFRRLTFEEAVQFAEQINKPSLNIPRSDLSVSEILAILNDDPQATLSWKKSVGF